MNCEHRFQPYPDSQRLFCPKCGLAVDPFRQVPVQQPPLAGTARRSVRRRARRQEQPADPVAAAEAELARQLAAQAEETNEDLDQFAEVLQNVRVNGRPAAGFYDGAPSAEAFVPDDGSSLGRGTGL